MAGEPDMMRATFILMATILLSIIIVTVIAPIADMADYKISTTDSRSFPIAGAMMHTVHNYMYYVIFFINLVVAIWYIKLAFSVHSYTREFG